MRKSEYQSHYLESDSRKCLGLTSQQPTYLLIMASLSYLIHAILVLTYLQ